MGLRIIPPGEASRHRTRNDQVTHHRVGWSATPWRISQPNPQSPTRPRTPRRPHQTM